MTTTSSVRAWIESILDWAANNNLTIDRFTDAECSASFPKGKLYINMRSQACNGPRLATRVLF